MSLGSGLSARLRAAPQTDGIAVRGKQNSEIQLPQHEANAVQKIRCLEPNSANSASSTASDVTFGAP
jgi:hypothetical protein